MKLFKDEKFKNGLRIIEQERPGGREITAGIWSFDKSEGEPSWQVDQWYSKYCLWHNRAESDKYTITDGKSKWLTYDEETGAMKMRLNASNVYEGRAAGDELWPHLLLEQKLPRWQDIPEDEKPYYSADTGRMTLKLDVRMNEFNDTTNPEGINACQFFAYFYLKLKDSHQFVYMGIYVFDSRDLMEDYWHIDTVGTEMIYIVSTEETFGKREDTFNVDKDPERWRSIRIDLDKHIDKVIELLNKENTYGRKVTRSDFYIQGTNIGYEIHGNFDCTIEIKNYNIVSEI